VLEMSCELKVGMNQKM